MGDAPIRSGRVTWPGAVLLGLAVLSIAAAPGAEAQLPSCTAPPIRDVSVAADEPTVALIRWSTVWNATVTGWIQPGGRADLRAALPVDAAGMEARLEGLAPASRYEFQLTPAWTDAPCLSTGNVVQGEFATPRDAIDLASGAALALPVVAGIGLAGLAAMVARTGWQHTHNRIFAALFLLSGVKSVTDGLLALADETTHTRWADDFHRAAPLFPESEVWLHLNAWCSFAMIPLLFLFVNRFPRPAKWVSRWPMLQLAPVALVPLMAAVYYLTPAHNYGLGIVPLGNQVVAVIGTLVTVFALVVMVRTRHRSPSPIERRQATYILIGWLPGFLATWVITGLLFHFNETQALTSYTALVWTNSYASPLFELLSAAAVAFAILKYRILDFELQVKGGAKYAIMTLVISTVLFVGTTLIGSIILENQVFAFAGDSGAPILAGVTGMLMFRPVENLSGKVTDRLFPDTMRDKRAYENLRKHDIYLAQVTQILRDGNVTAREWAFLHSLRDQLGLVPAQARAVEEEAERQVGVDIAALGASATPPVRMGAAATPTHPEGPAREAAQAGTAPRGADGESGATTGEGTEGN